MEICSECGKPVDIGSGRFINRIVDFNSMEERKQTGRPYPNGDFVCARCDKKWGEQKMFEEDIEKIMEEAEIRGLAEQVISEMNVKEDVTDDEIIVALDDFCHRRDLFLSETDLEHLDDMVRELLTR